MSDHNNIKLSRRQFLIAGGAATAALCWMSSSPFAASASKTSADDSASILIDVSRCQGCNSCALACKEANGLPVEHAAPQALSDETYCYVDEREVVNADGETEIRHIKRQCMHCLDAACVSACPAAAMHKSENGAVIYRANRCLGCRYCQIACPFGVPQFDWNNGLGAEIHKCWMCAERLAEGKEPACVEACPTGAIRFGKRSALLAQARARIASNPERYIDHIYGEHEVGGTSVLYISDVPFDQLGLPVDLATTAPPEETAKIMVKLPFVIGGLAVALAGTTVYTHRDRHIDTPEESED